MNIFVLDENPFLAARMLCDSHAVKMGVEGAQILSTVSFLRGVYHKDFYKPTHVKHPCVKWAGESKENYCWLIWHTRGILEEYSRRYNRIHKTMLVIEKIHQMAFETWSNFCSSSYHDHTPFANAIKEPYKTQFSHLDIVSAYREYYKADKSKFAKWKHSSTPSWWNVKNDLTKE